MSEQAAHAAGPPGPAALPQHQQSSQLGQSPQLPCRTASFHDDGCVVSHSTSNSVAASKSETIHDGRHPIYDGGALSPKAPDDPAAIGHFMVTEVGKTPRDETLPEPQELSRSRFPSESETPLSFLQRPYVQPEVEKIPLPPPLLSLHPSSNQHHRHRSPRYSRSKATPAAPLTLLARAPFMMVRPDARRTSSRGPY